MFKLLKEKTEYACKAVWQHRVSYAGLALAYGLGCVGWIEKDLVQQLATGLYVAITMQRH